MNLMTPEEARRLLAWPEGKDHPKVRDGSGETWFEVQAGESHPYWNRLPDAPYEDAVMYAAARDALATVAGMRTEWSRQARITGDPEWHPIRWCRSREEAERTYWTRSLPSGATVEYRIVPRYIIEPETTNGRKHEYL